MKKYLVSYSLFMALSLILSACAAAAPTQDAGQIAAQVEAQVSTRVAQAMAALDATQNAKPTLTPFIPTVGGATPTIAPIGGIPTIAPLPGVATAVACNPPPTALSETYPDNAQVYVNTNFNKSWTVRNAGTCTWNANYKLKFISGDSMNGPAEKLFGVSVPPGGSITLTLGLKTPGAVGTTTGYWGFYDDKGAYFGRAWVTINSVAYTPTATSFLVTGVTFVNNATHTCQITAAITANGAGTVTFTWKGPTVADYSGITPFSVAGTIGVNSPIYTPGTTGVSLYIQPNNIAWPAATIAGGVSTPITIPAGCT